MDIANRIVGYGMVKVDEILLNPKNWRKHPIYQERALEGVLEEIGLVQNIIINKTTGNLVDGHLRVQIAKKDGIEELPCTFIEVSEAEEDLILAMLDPIGAMADKNQDALNELVDSVTTANEDIQAVLDALRKDTEEATEEVLIRRSIQLQPPMEYVMIVCKTDEEFTQLRQLMGLGMVRRGGYREGSDFDDVGAERLIYFERFMEWLNANRNTE